MKRKIIKQANQAYTITLPIEWVRQNNLEKNLEVDVAIDDKSLIISNKGRTQIKKKSVNLDSLVFRNVTRIIQALYAQGVDELELISKKDISRDFTRALRDTLGFALVSQKDSVYTIKDISGTNYSDLDEIFKRVFQMILLFYESAIKDIYGKEEESIESVDLRDSEINKFCLFLERAVNKMSYPDQINGRILFAYAYSLEKIGDEIHRLWRTNIKYPIKKISVIKEMMDISSQGLSRAFEFYYQFNPSIAEEIYAFREKVREKSMSMTKLDAHTLRFVRHIVKIIEEAADLSHLTLMKNL
jgi:phosphate uptake regulator